MAIIEKLIRMKKRKGSDTVISYPQTLDTNVLVDNKSMTLAAKLSTLSSGGGGNLHVGATESPDLPVGGVWLDTNGN